MRAIERWVRRVGAVAALVCLASALFGLWRGLQRPKGRATGQAQKALQVPVYLLVSADYLGLGLILWRPLPLRLSRRAHSTALGLGTLLYFPGLVLYLWGRFTLGRMYNVSSAAGAQLYANHRLITTGPYGLIRHPMYVGLLVAGLGGILLYETWTPVLFAVTFFGLMLRARREEQALAAEFGEQWQAYAQRVPAWVPRLIRPHP